MGRPPKVLEVSGGPPEARERLGGPPGGLGGAGRAFWRFGRGPECHPQVRKRLGGVGKPL